MPAMRPVSRRRSANTLCIAGRSPRGFSSTNIRPLFNAFPPTMDATLATCGDARKIFSTCCCNAVMASNEMSCRASVETESCPMSSCGNSPLGVIMSNHAVPTSVAPKTTSIHGLWRRLICSVRS